MITTHLPGQFVEQGCGGDMFPGRLLLFVAGIIRLNVRKKDADASNQERCHCYSIVVILLCSARSRWSALRSPSRVWEAASSTGKVTWLSRRGRWNKLRIFGWQESFGDLTCTYMIYWTGHDLCSSLFCSYLCTSSAFGLASSLHCFVVKTIDCKHAAECRSWMSCWALEPRRYTLTCRFLEPFEYFMYIKLIKLHQGCTLAFSRH